MACHIQDILLRRATDTLVPIRASQYLALQLSSSLPLDIPTIPEIKPAIAVGGGKANDMDDVVV
jgi:hypothetical protein